MTRPVLLAAGGTGGHLFPAQALAHALGARGVPVELVTDERALRYGGEFPARAMHTISAATPRGGSAIDKARAVALLGLGTLQALRHLLRMRPRAVVGFGGYPSVPPLFAATLLRIPTVLHEANAVMGRANGFLAQRVDAIAAGFPLAGAPAALAGKITVTGNPLRPAALAAAQRPYPDFADGKLRLLVTGGSQGARIMADIAPPALELLPQELRERIELTQQTREEDLARVATAHARAGIVSQIAPFFADLPERIAAAHLVVARAGASTVTELAVIGRPSILVPLPHALDQDQAANAAVLAEAGAAEVVAQKDFTPQWLAARIADLFAHPELLAERARAARAVGVADAAERLADLVLALPERRSAR
ncbi:MULTISPECIES: undecaprenyldiphospho-muramoylpentapeptide beta-N-acetylglucosaminyltransferase [Methylosinus]|uniref:UDP-N-acetylglucosamine--N-acetylmuramyl-(pentapeptide) pyrophosphoryl-undecaprenol N-acetylglucosamine transferase n=1 Tax=Methylosinus trichosporium (strain ATCC 35070 / NCIMB 11131 / UNIQEM 75 / OB3b) TaxID=595536 RepID=A0A2D2D0I3_METT3|nr:MULTISPECIES: undecaprenyldiphospho-muramoylpentapeptide beta-N-acetylglucosaminyltransferase [Methylosinus]ATQ68389.1 undecaprenyldiphospho-muramoylpentapeptide beta-N-acetylglucosaminyltransferase [Methylosinus trichosporium OB3b]OBS51371.1 undecaprenyldiphospho-muramoylpentapeptide beta-N-acetylglucosaminyltransferase [Methylosinus sp. 3S-1]